MGQISSLCVCAHLIKITVIWKVDKCVWEEKMCVLVFCMCAMLFLVKRGSGKCHWPKVNLQCSSLLSAWIVKEKHRLCLWALFAASHFSHEKVSFSTNGVTIEVTLLLEALDLFSLTHRNCGRTLLVSLLTRWVSFEHVERRVFHWFVGLNEGVPFGTSGKRVNWYRSKYLLADEEVWWALTHLQVMIEFRG